MGFGVGWVQRQGLGKEARHGFPKKQELHGSATSSHYRDSPSVTLWPTLLLPKVKVRSPTVTESEELHSITALSQRVRCKSGDSDGDRMKCEAGVA